MVYRAAETALLRASAIPPGFQPPQWPEPSGNDPWVHEGVWVAWLRHLWGLEWLAEAVAQASPSLAEQVRAVCAGRPTDPHRIRRIVVSMTGYVLRATTRATPFGLFAGVANVRFGGRAQVRWPGQHHPHARLDPAWLSGTISMLESDPAVRMQLRVVTNNLWVARAGRLVLSQPSMVATERLASEVSIRHTAAVSCAIDAARQPTPYSELVRLLSSDFPAAAPAQVESLLAELVRCRVLVSELWTPLVETDPLGHLCDRLAAISSQIPHLADKLSAIVELRSILEESRRTPSAPSALRRRLGAEMARVAEVAAPSVAIDLRLDADVSLPRSIAEDAARTAVVLLRLSPEPFGSQAWRAYHTRFLERYGVGCLVRLTDVVDPEAGLGPPAGYQGSLEPTPEVRLTNRDVQLLQLAQQSAMAGCDEVELREGDLRRLAVVASDRLRLPQHGELSVQVHARSRSELEGGDWQLHITGVSRSAGAIAGRFLDLLGQDARVAWASVLHRAFGGQGVPLPAQLTHPVVYPRNETLGRAPELLDATISLGEHRADGRRVVPVDDLAVVADEQRLWLVRISDRCALEPIALHALDLRSQVPPIARFLLEINRAQQSALRSFDWGAASHLAYLPRVRWQRSILSGARWRIVASALPDRRAGWREWREAVHAWRQRYRVPDRVCVQQVDRRLSLDLTVTAHLALVRARLDRSGELVLSEAPGQDALGWLDGRPHELVVPFLANREAPAEQPSWYGPVVGRGHGHQPGSRKWLYTKLYAHPDLQDELLARYIPELITTASGEVDEPLEWWFVRFGDPRPHIRVRVRLSGAKVRDAFVHHLGEWASAMRRQGSIAEVDVTTYRPEIGRYGAGEAMTLAERVFAADSAAVIAVLRHGSSEWNRLAFTVAGMVDLVCGYTGSVERGMRWLFQHARVAPGQAVDRETRIQILRLADPSADDYLPFQGSDGSAMRTAWQHRRETLSRYRRHLDRLGWSDPDRVARSFLHMHHNRARGPFREDEQSCLRLARAVAVTWLGRLR